MEAFCCGKIKRERSRQAGKASDGKSPTIFYFLRKNLVNGIIQKSKNLQFYFSGRCGKRLCCVFLLLAFMRIQHKIINCWKLSCVLFSSSWLLTHTCELPTLLFYDFVCGNFHFLCVLHSFFILYYIKALAITIEYTLCMYT